MKKWHAIICACFVVPLLTLSLWSLFDKDAAFSVSENRRLAPRPTLSLRQLFAGDTASLAYLTSGEFAADYEAYYADAFPLREKLLSGSRLVNRLYYISLGGNTTIIEGGIDHNWEGGGQNIFDMTDFTDKPAATTTPKPTSPATTPPQTTTPPATATESTPWQPITHPDGESPEPPDNDSPVDVGAIIIIGDRAMEHYYGVEKGLEHYAQVLSNIKNHLPETNVFAVFCPTAIEFNAPSTYQAGVRSQLRAMNTAYGNLDPSVVPVDVWSALYAHKDEYLYFRTDHHWTQRGAYYAYTAFAKAAGFAPTPLSAYERGEITGFIGTMYAYTKNVPQAQALKNNPDTVEYFLPTSAGYLTASAYANGNLTNGRPIQVVYEDGSRFPASWKYGVFLGGDHPVAHIRNEAVSNGKKLLVTKESYGNALIPFLVDHYEEVFVIDPREFNGAGKPAFQLPAFVVENGITDVACVNYSFSATGSFMDLLGRMLP